MIEKPNKDIVYAKPIAYEFTYYLSESVMDSNEYHEVLQLLETATENDTIRLVINNYGGQAGTCAQLVNAIRECRAHVIGVLSGEAYSAAGIIFMACDSHEVGMHTVMMIHQGIGGQYGKLCDLPSQIQASLAQAKSLYNDVFEHFLTQEEIDSVLDGRDMWFNTPEIVDRLEKRSKAFEKESQTRINEYQQALATLEAETENLNYEDLIKLPTKKAILEALGITPEDK